MIIKKEYSKSIYIFLVLLVLTCNYLIFKPWICDFEDALSNEVIFARESIYNLFYKMRWSNQSPLYFLLLKSWANIFGEGHFISRSYNIPISVLSAWTIYIIGQYFWKNRLISFTAAALYATTPYNISLFHAGRMYPLFNLLFLCGVLVTFKFCVTNHTKWLLFLSVLCILAVYNHYLAFWPFAILYSISIFNSIKVHINQKFTNNNNNLNIDVSVVILITTLTLIALSPQIIRVYQYLFIEKPLTNRLSLPNGLLNSHLLISKKLLLAPYHSTFNGGVAYIFEYLILASQLLCILGILASRGKVLIGGLFWIIISYSVLIILGQYLDIRYRYFYFILPGVFLYLAFGLWSVLSRIRFSNYKCIKTTYTIISIILLTLNFSFTSSQTTFRFPNWSQFVSILDKLPDSSRANIFVIPGYIHSGIRLSAELQHSKIDYKNIRKISFSNRNLLNSSIVSLNTIILVRTRGYLDLKEFEYWINNLKRNGYREERLWLNGLMTSILSPSKERALLSATIKAPCDSKLCDSKKYWLNYLIESKRSSYAFDELQNLKILRVIDESRAMEPLYYINDPLTLDQGEWQLSNSVWDSVTKIETNIDKRKKKVIYFHTQKNKELYISFPKKRFPEGLEIQAGILDSNSKLLGDPRATILDFYADNEAIGRIAVDKSLGWRTYCFDTEKFLNQEINLNLIVKEKTDLGRGIGIIAERKACVDQDMRTINLTKGPLSSQISKIQAGLKGEQQIVTKAKTYLEKKYTNKDLHEFPINEQEGGLVSRWFLGENIWQSVGEASQIIGGVRTKGVWIHPHRDEELVLVLKAVKYKNGLSAWFAFTDHSLKISKKQNLNEPVNVTIELNGNILQQISIERKKGINKFQLTKGEQINQSGDTLKITIGTKNNSWSHLIGDLSDEITIKNKDGRGF